ncbi:DeoR/GlpR family DNA-binding transcription regulator [Oharaeibacter diazotrophicus]|uniref:DeoR family transcriptional regulator n=1 Tax=Oharaeibacter diazotrophicus TaxID=1920512 RepID=A0A4R6RIR5_9HYPH|nr:DeoR/GlpR family DNA-binding transcription regulator [Oharaeibacter diazotrophicus]TDP86320.1 DeoR family transcriptional regulator [Oharaeibacter diazotrophicus]BBE71737.1 HTH-type transcriptional regulator UlaR [Pleomorphomonas sp. SM30]GLS78503.1 DeoR family transcriptional regulator [Oharaeibacter diazotrophicus]
MHERERHRIILAAVQERPVATVPDIVELTGASEATIRRDIAALALQGRVRKVRGGAEAVHPPQFGTLSARPFRVDETVRTAEKRAVAREAAKYCADGDAVIINAGTTTFQMVHHVAHLRMQVLTNSFPIAEYLVKHSKCSVILPAGAVYREQGVIVSPFDNDGIAHFYGRRMFMSARGVSKAGIMEQDSLISQSEQRLMRQADETILLVDSSKFENRSSLILCPLDRVSVIVTDDGVTDEARRMVEAAGVTLVVAEVTAADRHRESPSVA